MNDVTVIQIKPQTVIGLRKRGPYSLIPTLLKELYEFAMEKGIPVTGHPTFVCHETAEEALEAMKTGNADVEVAVPVSGKVEVTGDIKCYELPGGTMARIIHKGPYGACEPTYLRLFAWLEENGKQLAGPTRELYLNDPREVGPSETLTEIHAPIE